MENTITKYITQIVGNDICVETEDGKKVYDVIIDFINKGQPLTLSFINVKILTSAFLNTAIGLLYKDHDEESVKKFLHVEGLTSSDLDLLKRVVETAKVYYKDPERIEKSVKEILEED